MPNLPPPQFQLQYQSQLGAAVQVFQCDGAASITQSAMSNFPIQVLTLSFWVQTTQRGKNAEQAVLCTYDQKETNQKRLYIKNPTNLEVGFGSASTGPTGVVINDGHWHQITMTLSAADATHYHVQLYSDGLLLYQSLSALAFTAGNGLEEGGNLVVGQGDSSINEIGFVGALSEFRLWSQVCSHEQIWATLEQRLIGNETNLVLYWALDAAPTGATVRGGSFSVANLHFRTGQITVSISNFLTSSTYQLQSCQITGCRACQTASFTTSSYTISNPHMNQTYAIKLQVTHAGEMSPWSNEQQVVILNLDAVTFQPFQYNSSNQALTASWDAVDQAQQYQVTLFQDGTQAGAPTLQTGLSYNLPTQLSDTHAWSMQVNAVSVAAYSPNNLPTALASPVLTFDYVGETSNTGILEASWPTLLGATNYYLEVFKQSGNTWNQVFTSWTATTSVQISSTQVPTQEGDVFKARVRAVGLGVIGSWSAEQQTSVINLPRPVLSYNWDAATHALTVNWDEVAVGVTYWLQIFQDNDTTPLVNQPSMTARSYNLSSYLPQLHAYTIKVRGQKSGAIGPVNQIVVPPLLHPVYQYNGANATLSANWDVVPNAYLNLIVPSPDIPQQQFFPSTTSTYTVPVPSGGFQEGSQYTFQMRALAEGTLANREDGSVTIHHLAQPIVNFVYSASPDKLLAQWEDIRTQAQKDAGLVVTYRLQITIGATPQTPIEQTALNFDMTTYLLVSQTAQVTLQVTALAQGSLGIPSQVVAPSDLHQMLTYDQATTTLTASWQANNPVYLRIYKQGAEANAITHYAAVGTSSYQVPAPSGGFQLTDIWICQAKSLPLGTIGPLVTAQATILALAAPLPSFAYDSATKKLSLTWPDIRTSAQADLTVTYTASLYQVGNPTPVNTVSALPNTSAGRVYTLPEILATDAAFTVVIRGTAEGTLGLPNTLPTLTAANATALTYQAATGIVSAHWDAATGAPNILYYLEILDGSNVVASEMQSSLSTSFALSAVSGQIYQAQVRALAAGTITAYAGTKRSVTTYPNMVAPTVQTPTVNVSAQTVAASWDFATTPYPSGSVSYLAVLSGDASATQTTTVQNVTFPNIVATAGKTYTVSVQALSGGTYGRTGTNTVVVNAPSKVQNVNATTDANANIIVSWNNLAGANYTYSLRITGPNGFSYTDPSTPGNGPVTLPQSATRVTANVTYQVAVAALSNGLAGPWSDPASVTAGKVQPVPPNNQPNAPTSGDPINLANGNFSDTRLDLVFGGIFPLQFITYYNIYTPIHSENAWFDSKPMGNRWNHCYNTQITQDTPNHKAYIRWGHGAIDTFTIPSGITGPYAVDGVYNGTTLVLGADLVYTVTTKDQTRYLFSQNGALHQIISPIGNTITLSYQNNRLDRVTDNQNGRWFQLAYNGDGRISTVSDSANRSISYAYYSNGDLQSYTDPLGKARTYIYWDSNGLANTSLLKTATDQNNLVVLYNEYAAYTVGGITKYRVTFQQDANAYAASQQPTPVHYGTSLSYSQSGTGEQEMLTTTLHDNMDNQTVYQSLVINGNVLSAVTTLAAGNIFQRTFTYDAFNNPLNETLYEGPASEISTHGGNTRTFTYDGNLNLATIAYPAPIGQTHGYTYYPNNLVKTAMDQAGNTMSYEYNPDLTLKQVTDYLGRTTSYTYVPGAIKGLVQTKTDELGNVFTSTYIQDELNTVVDPLGNVTQYHWNNLGLNTSIEYRNATGETLQTRLANYNTMGFQSSSTVQVAGQTLANAYTTSATPTPLNQIQTQTDSLGNTTSFTYDPNLNVKTITYPAASGFQAVTTNGYDHNNNLTSVQRAPTIIERYTYDPLQRRQNYTDPNQNTFTTLYAWVFQGYSTPFPLAVTTQYPQLAGNTLVHQTTEVYDVLTRLIAQTNRSGQTTTLAYSTQHDPVTQTQQRVVTITYPQAVAGDSSTRYQTVTIFDALERPVSYTDQAQQTTTFTYSNASGGPNNSHVLLVTETDPLHKQKISTFDALGRLITLMEGKDSLVRTTRFSYDALGRLINVTNVRTTGNVETNYTYTYESTNNTVQVNVGRPGVSQSTRLTFNGARQLLSESDALGRATLRTYHPRGLLHTYQQANGKTLTYDYDSAGRYDKLTLSDQSNIVQTLDANGNALNTSSGNQIHVTRIFDKWNRLTAYTNNHQNTLDYTYTLEDKLHVLTYPAVAGESSRKQVTYTYDGLQQLSSVTDWQNRLTSYTYAPTGLLSSITYPNQCTTQFQFDPASRLTGLVNSAQDRVVYAANYTLDALNNPTAANFILPLTPSMTPQNNTYVYNDADELVTLNGANITYDNAGNTATLPGVSAITHNDSNLITTYGSDTYGYDVEGLRDVATIGNVTTRFIRKPNQFSAPYLQQASPNQAIVAADIYQSPTGSMGLAPLSNTDPTQLATPFSSALDQVLQTVDSADTLQKRYIYGLGLIAEESATGDYHVYLFDERGSTVALSDGTGALTSRFAYSPFGTLTAHTGEMPLYLYNGRDGVISDPNGLNYMRTRYFHPVQLRFLERDFLFGDLHYPQTLNRYAYVTGNPLGLIDPLGLDSSSGWKIFGGIVAGIATGVIVGGVLGLLAGGAAGGSAAAGAGAGIVAGGITGGVVGGLIAGPVGGLVGGAIGAGGGGFIGSSGATIGGRLVTLGGRFGSQYLLRFGNWLRGPYSSAYRLVPDIELDIL